MKIVGSKLDFEAMTARIKFFTKLEGGYINFKIFYGESAIFENKIRVETFKKIFTKLEKINSELSKV